MPADDKAETHAGGGGGDAHIPGQHKSAFMAFLGQLASFTGDLRSACTDFGNHESFAQHFH